MKFDREWPKKMAPKKKTSPRLFSQAGYSPPETGPAGAAVVVVKPESELTMRRISRRTIRIPNIGTRSLFVRTPHEMKTRALLSLAIVLYLLLASAPSRAAELKQETVQAWDAYIRATNLRMEERASGKSLFLWVDEKPDRAQRVRAGEVLVTPVVDDNPHKVPHGLIHDWIGARFVSL